MLVGEVTTQRGDCTGGQAIEASDVPDFAVGPVGEQVDVGREDLFCGMVVVGKGKGGTDVRRKGGLPVNAVKWSGVCLGGAGEPRWGDRWSRVEQARGRVLDKRMAASSDSSSTYALQGDGNSHEMDGRVGQRDLDVVGHGYY